MPAYTHTHTRTHVPAFLAISIRHCLCLPAHAGCARLDDASLCIDRPKRCGRDRRPAADVPGTVLGGQAAEVGGGHLLGAAAQLFLCTCGGADLRLLRANASPFSLY
eukprot:scaffold26072_cov16-Tisochrysis_lutea.AAC.2